MSTNSETPFSPDLERSGFSTAEINNITRTQRLAETVSLTRSGKEIEALKIIKNEVTPEKLDRALKDSPDSLAITCGFAEEAIDAGLRIRPFLEKTDKILLDSLLFERVNDWYHNPKISEIAGSKINPVTGRRYPGPEDKRHNHMHELTPQAAAAKALEMTKNQSGPAQMHQALDLALSLAKNLTGTGTTLSSDLNPDTALDNEEIVLGLTAKTLRQQRRYFESAREPQTIEKIDSALDSLNYRKLGVFVEKIQRAAHRAKVRNAVKKSGGMETILQTQN